MIILRQKEFRRDDSDRLGLNLLGKLRYKKGISELAEKTREAKKRYGNLKPYYNTISPEDCSTFNHHKLNMLLGISKIKRKDLEEQITSNPWNKKGAIPKYVKQLISD